MNTKALVTVVTLIVVAVLVAVPRTVKASDTDAKAEYAQALAAAECAQALAAYEKALGELNIARTLAAMPKRYPNNGIGGLLGALNTVAEPLNLAEKEKAVIIAIERLEMAKARMMYN
jgi:hypothetical protein